MAKRGNRFNPSLRKLNWTQELEQWQSPIARHRYTCNCWSWFKLPQQQENNGTCAHEWNLYLAEGRNEDGFLMHCQEPCAKHSTRTWKRSPGKCTSRVGTIPMSENMSRTPHLWDTPVCLVGYTPRDLSWEEYSRNKRDGAILYDPTLDELDSVNSID